MSYEAEAMKAIQTASWEMDIAPSWSFSKDPECWTITKSDDGALQISTAVKNDGAVLPEELTEFADINESWGAVELVTLGHFKGIAVSYTELDEDVSWKRYWVAHENVLVMITYNAIPAVFLLEEHDVNKMLKTLRKN